MNPICTQDYLRLGSSKLFWAWYRFVVPYAVFNCSPLDIALLSFITDTVVGYWLAFNFQVSHISTECEFYAGEDNKMQISEEWGPVQVG